jgi:hypothetical protein
LNSKPRKMLKSGSEKKRKKHQQLFFASTEKSKTVSFFSTSFDWAHSRFSDHSLYLSSGEFFFNCFFRRRFSTENKKKLLCWVVSKTKKNYASPSDIKKWEGKKHIALFFFLVNFWKKIVFSSNFSWFSLFLRKLQCVLIFFRFFCHKQWNQGLRERSRIVRRIG